MGGCLSIKRIRQSFAGNTDNKKVNPDFKNEQHQTQANSKQQFANMQVVVITSSQLSKNNQPQKKQQPPAILQEGIEEKGDQLSVLISKACRTKDNLHAIEQLQSIVKIIAGNKEKSLQLMEKLAYTEVCLAGRLQTVDASQCDQHEKRALQIYTQFESEYYQEIIVILNNSALRLEQAKKYEEAIAKYQTITKLEDRYYSITDERKLVNLNNLACAYFDSGRVSESQQVFEELLSRLKDRSYSKEIKTLVEDNHRFYFQEGRK